MFSISGESALPLNQISGYFLNDQRFLSMKAFGKIDSQFWTDKRLRSVSKNARYLALYLLSCPHGNMLGIFKLPVAYALSDLQWGEEQWSAARKELRCVDFMDYCDEEEYVSIMQFQQIAPASNAKQLDHRVKLLEKLPQMILDIEQPASDLFKKSFAYGETERYRNRIDTVLQRFHNAINSGLQRKRVESGKTESEIDNEHSIVPSGDDTYALPNAGTHAQPHYFESWWTSYPKGELEREDKETVLTHYLVAMKRGYSEEELLNALKAYIHFCRQTNKVGTEFVFKPSTFLGSDEHLQSDWESYPDMY